MVLGAGERQQRGLELLQLHGAEAVPGKPALEQQRANALRYRLEYRLVESVVGDAAAQTVEDVETQAHGRPVGVE